MRTFLLSIVDIATLFWKREVYSVRDGENSSRRPSFLGFFIIRLVESQAMALDFTSWCSNAVLKLAMKTVKVPMAMVDPTRVLCQNVVAQVRVGPSVM